MPGGVEAHKGGGEVGGEALAIAQLLEAVGRPHTTCAGTRTVASASATARVSAVRSERICRTKAVAPPCSA